MVDVIPERKPPMKPTYLGDGAYAEFDDYGIVLYTSDGISRTNQITLDPEVYQALVDYAQSIWGARPEEADKTDRIAVLESALRRIGELANGNIPPVSALTSCGKIVHIVLD